MPSDITHFIGGQPVAGNGARSVPVFNSATGEQTGRVPLASSAEVAKAVATAKAAFPGWARTTPLRRARVLNRFLRLLEHLPLGLLDVAGLQQRHRAHRVLRRILDPAMIRRWNADPFGFLRPWNEVPALMGSAPPGTSPSTGTGVVTFLMG
jgi:hypothetical protein